MLEQTALNLLSETITLALGLGTPAATKLDGFRPFQKQHDLAKAIGSAGRVVELRIHGWGLCFEARQVVAQVAVNLSQSRDEVTQSVLIQLQTVLQYQMAQRLRAASLGIARPLDERGFLDLSRLQIDVAAAHHLLSCHGSDEMVRWWLQDQLKIWLAPRTRDLHPTIHIDGCTVAIPFLLNPMEIRPTLGPSLFRPYWRSSEIRLLCSRDHDEQDVRVAVSEATRNTHLDGRQIEQCSLSPPPEFSATDLRIARQAHSPVSTSFSRHVEWHAIIEMRPVSVAEAFG